MVDIVKYYYYYYYYYLNYYYFLPSINIIPRMTKIIIIVIIIIFYYYCYYYFALNTKQMENRYNQIKQSSLRDLSIYVEYVHRLYTVNDIDLPLLRFFSVQGVQCSHNF